jgi:hypothetical protein
MADTKSIKIKLYLLERIESPGHGEMASHLVAASSEKAAREIANGVSKDEGYLWTDGHLVTATALGEAYDDIEGVLMSSREEKE